MKYLIIAVIDDAEPYLKGQEFIAFIKRTAEKYKEILKCEKVFLYVF